MLTSRLTREPKPRLNFRRILSQPGLPLADPVGPTAQLHSARAYGMQGDTAKATQAYQDFLTLWKDTDPDVPNFKQAKVEYAKLQ
jgi:eukaryotic-like serine/threonine-protein kinase